MIFSRPRCGIIPILKVLFLQFVCVFILGCSEKKENKEIPESTETKTASELFATRPNIILLMADDQGWGDIGYNGHPHLKTPNLDAMAANGATYNRFYAASAVCSPTRGSVMSGRHPLRYGICHANCGHIKKQEITLGEILKNKGYSTGHFGKWHLGTLTRDTLDANRGGRPKYDGDYAPPWDHGFDVSFVTESKVPTWNPMITPHRSSGDVNKNLKEGEPFNTFYWTGPGQIVTENLEGDDSRIIMDRAIPFMKDAAKNKKPFLSIIWFHTPHLPVLTGERYSGQYSDLSTDQQQYYGVITALDEQIGRLRNKLRELGIEENTLLFYTSDNGPEGKSTTGRTQGLTNGLKGRKRSLHEGGIRVPGIVEWPKTVLANTKIEAPTFTSDYFPTIAYLAGVDLQPFERPYDGENMIPYLMESGLERNRPMAFEFQQQAALIDNQYKIYRPEEDSPFELYDIVNDPGETKNLANKKVEKLKELETDWKDWKKSQNNSAKGNDY